MESLAEFQDGIVKTQRSAVESLRKSIADLDSKFDRMMDQWGQHSKILESLMSKLERMQSEQAKNTQDIKVLKAAQAAQELMLKEDLEKLTRGVNSADHRIGSLKTAVHGLSQELQAVKEAATSPRELLDAAKQQALQELDTRTKVALQELAAATTAAKAAAAAAAAAPAGTPSTSQAATGGAGAPRSSFRELTESQKVQRMRILRVNNVPIPGTTPLQQCADAVRTALRTAGLPEARIPLFAPQQVFAMKGKSNAAVVTIQLAAQSMQEVAAARAAIFGTVGRANRAAGAGAYSDRIFITQELSAAEQQRVKDLKADSRFTAALDAALRNRAAGRQVPITWLLDACIIGAGEQKTIWDTVHLATLRPE